MFIIIIIILIHYTNNIILVLRKIETFMHYQCIVLVIAHHDNGGCYDQFKQLWVSHWNKSIRPDLQIFYLYNNNNNIIKNSHSQSYENDLYFPFEESVNCLIHKTMAAFQYLNDQGITYDYIFRTNLSSCIDWSTFLSFLPSIINEHSPGFGGSYYTYKGKNHASGSGYFISYNLVQTLLHDKRQVLDMANQYREDDVILNTYLQNVLDVVPFRIHRIDVTSPYPGTFGRHNSHGKNKQCFHYRFKTHDRCADVANMKAMIDIMHSKDYVIYDDVYTVYSVFMSLFLLALVLACIYVIIILSSSSFLYHHFS